MSTTTADGDNYDPNKDLPPWVNIVVPISCAVIFVVVLVVLYHTKKEIPVETLERWTNKLPFCSNNHEPSPDVEKAQKRFEPRTTNKAQNKPRISLLTPSGYTRLPEVSSDAGIYNETLEITEKEHNERTNFACGSGDMTQTRSNDYDTFRESSAL